MLCGIPWITLDGTTQDWQNILGRLEKLKEYDLLPWYELLHPIIKTFVAAKKGKNSPKFWRAIVDRYAGSGFDYISGWITAFCVFDSDGNWQHLIKLVLHELPVQPAVKYEEWFGFLEGKQPDSYVSLLNTLQKDNPVLNADKWRVIGWHRGPINKQDPGG
ncbi:unnamed protein product [Orchesella dallaii]|uniref:Uncharacterized protein n=1 Tax=Orchesella dallaii TaxID=48710 RepID=A0ABP1PVK3_9HEXA